MHLFGFHYLIEYLFYSEKKKTCLGVKELKKLADHEASVGRLHSESTQLYRPLLAHVLNEQWLYRLSTALSGTPFDAWLTPHTHAPLHCFIHNQIKATKYLRKVFEKAFQLVKANGGPLSPLYCTE